jgi:hypothetical protein
MTEVESGEINVAVIESIEKWLLSYVSHKTELYAVKSVEAQQ